MMRFLISLALIPVGVTSLASPADAVALDDTPWSLPVTPPRCTTAQADSGDVADCLLVAYHDPADTGWGTPPAPGVGSGWNWLGWTYNGSPALADWEATRIVANTTPVAGKRVGYLQLHAGVHTLFEGFLNDIAEGGYVVRDVGGYSFRCTSGSGGWSCPSGDTGGLSNHAWGLAIDMNAGTNPIRNYAGVDGRTACQTPMQTDMPQWVVQTAEKWGLYWGGYGWNSGCQSTSTQRSTVYRDPPHFEFRGTPSQAAAIAAHNLRDDPAATCFDVVDDAGAPAVRCTLDPVPQAGWRMPVTVDAPTGAVAALVNLTAVGSSTTGSFTVEDCGPESATSRGTTALQFSPGSARATMAVAPLDDDGRFCVWRSAAAHSIVDIVGFLTGSGERLWVDPADPTRVTDTRREPTCSPDGTCTAGQVEARGIRRIETTDDEPRFLNVTTVGSDSRGYLQVGRCDDVGPDRTFSNLNFVDEDAARANLALAEGGGSGTCTYVHVGTHVVVDELARLTTDTGYGWRLTDAGRVHDTRSAVPARTIVEIDLGTDAPAVAATVTISDTTTRGFATVAPCDELRAEIAADGMPETSSVNHAAHRDASNLAIVEADAGTICVYTHVGGRITIDLQAELVDAHTIGLAPVTPLRVHDTRD
jgi:hypothetical protein